jgi:hypothetical protein
VSIKRRSRFDNNSKNDAPFRRYQYQTDSHACSSLQEYQAYQADDPFQANKFLITVSLLEVDENDPRLPAPGAIVSFTPF